jgi:hypothetical protein
MADNSPPTPEMGKNMEWLEPDPEWRTKGLSSEAEAVHEWSGEAFGSAETATAASEYPGVLWEKDGKLWPIEAKIREKPGAALLVALGAGFLAGTLWKRS